MKKEESRSKIQFTMNPNQLSESLYRITMYIIWYVGSEISCCIQTTTANDDLCVLMQIGSHIATKLPFSALI